MIVCRQLARRMLEPEITHLLGRGADEGNAFGFTGLGKFGIFT